MAGRRKWKVDLTGGRAGPALLLAGLFALGSLVGCMAAGAVRDPGGELSECVKRYLTLAADGVLNPGFWPVLWRTVRFALAVTVLGLTALGVVGIPLLFLAKGFALCYAVSVFYRLFGPVGLVPALILFGLSAFLWLPATLELGICGVSGACGLLRRVAGNGRSPLIRGGTLLRVGLCVAVLLLCVGVECVAVPKLLHEIAGSLLSG